MNGHTSIVQVDSKMQYFYSDLSRNVYGGDKLFKGVQFHFHAGSEHTVDNRRYDMEMHTVHTPSKLRRGIKYAAVGMLFSLDNYSIENVSN